MEYNRAAACHVTAIGTQTLADRYGKRRWFEYGDDTVPPISQWRSNLTALSQVHNLYFVAYGKDIYVYVPQFPCQAVPLQPVLILAIPPVDPNSPGSLDLEQPHSINNLLVQFLGTEEVITTVRDDGDIDAVLVRHVVQAIERRAQPGNSTSLVADEVKPIFQSNVGVSAWGLAIHTESRIIACSSNHHEVRIFKFGLFREDCQVSEDEEAASPLDGEVAPFPALDRKIDVTLRVINGEANIPCIAFCNTGDDPEARWLLTTDISGICRVMDLHSLTSVQRFRFGRPPVYRSPGAFDRLNAGWAIMFLDARSFKRERYWREALNIPEKHDLPGTGSTSSPMWDLSDTILGLPDRSETFTYHDQEVQSNEQNEHHSAALDQIESLSIEDGDEDEEDSRSPRSQVPDSTTSGVQPPREDEPDEEDNDVHDVDDDLDDEGTEDSISFSNFYGGRRVFGNMVQFNQRNSLCEDLPCPILHAAVKNVYLLQPSDERFWPGPFSPPMVGLASPLRQAVLIQFGALNMYDRLNMSAYIPSLGIVILASQKGRVLVLSLTKLSDAKHDSASPAGLSGKSSRTIFAMRCDCILPFLRQEKLNQRPFAPLHGIAVSPMQGTQHLPEERKRWRLVLMYQDHSILGYEIRRRGETRWESGHETVVV